MQNQITTPNEKIEAIENQIAKNNKTRKISKITNISVCVAATAVSVVCGIFTAGIAQWFVPVMAGCTALLTTRICAELSSQLKTSNKNLESEINSIKHSQEKQAKQQKVLAKENTQTKPQQTIQQQTEMQSQNQADGEEISIA